jgi:hypothetical protein
VQTVPAQTLECQACGTPIATVPSPMPIDTPDEVAFERAAELAIVTLRAILEQNGGTITCPGCGCPLYRLVGPAR